MLDALLLRVSDGWKQKVGLDGLYKDKETTCGEIVQVISGALIRFTTVVPPAPPVAFHAAHERSETSEGRPRSYKQIQCWEERSFLLIAIKNPNTDGSLVTRTEN